MRDRMRLQRFGKGGRFAIISWQLAPALEHASLTRAELEVALAAASGATNRAIASARRTSERTVANQLAAIYRKLSIASRGELAAVIAGTIRR